MDELSERLAKLKAFKDSQSASNLANAISTNIEVKREVESLSLLLLKKKLSGCSNCYADALIEILIIFSNNKHMEIAKQEWRLNAGAVLHDPVNLDSKKLLTNATLTEELVLWHLSQRPERIKSFFEKPDDWKQRVDDYKAEQAKQSEDKENSETAKEDSENKESDESEDSAKEASKRLDGLKQEATELGLTFPSNIGEGTLSKKIDDYKAEQAKQSEDKENSETAKEDSENKESDESEDSAKEASKRLDGLKQEATELGLTFPSNIGEGTLSKKIDDYKAEQAKQSEDKENSETAKEA